MKDHDHDFSIVEQNQMEHKLENRSKYWIKAAGRESTSHIKYQTKRISHISDDVNFLVDDWFFSPKVGSETEYNKHQ